MSEGQDSFNKFINDNTFLDFRESVTQIEDDIKLERHEPKSSSLQYQNQGQNQNDQRRPPRKRTRFDEPVIIPMDSNTNPTNIPSLLNIAIDPPPDIQIDLSDLRSDDEDENGGRQSNGNDEDENWDHY